MPPKQFQLNVIFNKISCISCLNTLLCPSQNFICLHQIFACPPQNSVLATCLVIHIRNSFALFEFSYSNNTFLCCNPNRMLLHATFATKKFIRKESNHFVNFVLDCYGIITSLRVPAFAINHNLWELARWPSGKVFVSGTGGLRFKSPAGQIEQGCHRLATAAAFL